MRSAASRFRLPSPRVGALLCCLYALAAVGMGLWPFDLLLDWGSIASRGADFELWLVYRDEGGRLLVDRDLVLNLLFLMPLGACWALWRRHLSWWRAGLEGLAVGLALSAVVEGLQILAPSRVPQLADIWRNAVGSGLAAAATALVIRRHLRPPRAGPARRGGRESS